MKLLETVSLYPGMELHYLDFASGAPAVHENHPEQIVRIHYCRLGRMGWQTEDGREVFLGPGDFSVHTGRACAAFHPVFPTGRCEGLVLCIDPEEALRRPPEPFDAALLQALLCDGFCKKETFTSLAGNAETQSIFSGFYHQPDDVRRSYQKIKLLELLLYLAKTKSYSENRLAEYRCEQVLRIQEMHDYLLANMQQRVTIKDLSKKYLMNPTTLKNTFKSVYGVSLASHIKEHRMNCAASLLVNSELSISEIAQQVGYDSQSRFSEAFKAYFHILPTEYRRQKRR